MEVPYSAPPFVFGTGQGATTFWKNVTTNIDRLACVVNEIWAHDVHNPFNHCQYYPHWVQFMVDSFPIACFSGATWDTTYQPKYQGHVWKITVGITFLGLICFWSGPDAGSANDGRLYGETCYWQQFAAQAWGLADGAYGNRPHLAIPTSMHAGSSSLSP